MGGFSLKQFPEHVLSDGRRMTPEQVLGEILLPYLLAISVVEFGGLIALTRVTLQRSIKLLA